MKIILKKFIVILLIICILIPSLFSGMVLADVDNTKLTQERAGNYAASFAINFYENWSSIGVVQGSSSSSSSGTPSSKAITTGNYNYIWPIELNNNVRVSSEFGPRSLDNHKGMDFAAAKGTPVYSSSSGVVKVTFKTCTHNYGKTVGCGCGGNYGNNIKIDTGNGCGIIYGHLTDVYVNEGDTVEQGQLIGTVGSTGWSTGNHLHFEFVTNNIQGLDSKDIIRRSSPVMGYLCSVNPRVYIDNNAEITSVEGSETTISNAPSTTKAEVRGEISTEYDENAQVSDIIESDTSTYKFSNQSWPLFVYKNALSMEANTVFDLNDKSKFETENEIFETKLVKNGEIIDISKLVNEGEIRPGDILYAADGKGSGEYLLYVGGTKVIYATKPAEVSISEEDDTKKGALRYEYLQYYLEKVKNNLIDGHEEDENFVIPQYGITKIYRISRTYGVTQANVKLSFNKKGYYSEEKYEGIPTTNQTTVLPTKEKDINVFQWIFDGLTGLAEFLLNTIIYVIKMQVVGWVNVVELILQTVLLGVSGDANTQMFSSFFGPDATSASGSRITVESIFFNQVPILDANFFNFETAGGHSLIKTTTYQPATASGQGEYEVVKVNDQSIVYQLRYNLRMWYVIVRNASIAIMLFILIYLGIRLAISSTGERKAETKKLLVAWVTAFLIVLFIHLYMFMVFEVNDSLVGMLKNVGEQVASTSVGNETSQELSLYDAIRVKAYSFSFKESVPATIMYIFLVYLLIRFTYIYFKRYLTIYILAISGSFMGVKYALEKYAGRKSATFGKWLKEFAFNVLLQTVHALIYVLYMSIAVNIAQDSVAGFFVCLIILNFMLDADKIIIKIFGMNKAGSLADVNKPEKTMNIINKFAPMFLISQRVIGNANKYVFGKRGAISELIYSAKGFDSYKDAEKYVENLKYDTIGKLQQLNDKIYSSIADLPALYKLKDNGVSVRSMRKALLEKFGFHAYSEKRRELLGENALEMKRAIYNSIKESKKLDRKKYTRPLGFARDLIFEIPAGVLSTVALTIDNPAAGIAAFYNTKKIISKHLSMSRNQRKHNIYKVSNSKAKMDYEKALNKYKNLMNTYVDNQFEYQQELNRLKDNHFNALDPVEKARYQTQINELQKTRAEQEAKELDELKEAYEKSEKQKVLYENAKFENRNNRFIKAIQDITGATTLAEMAQNEITGLHSDIEKSSKEAKKLEDLEALSKEEHEFNNLMKELQDKYDKYKQTNEGKNSSDTFNNDFAKLPKTAKKTTVNSGYIKKAIEAYMYEARVDKITEDNVDNVLDKLQELLEESGSGIVITSSLRKDVKYQIKEKMIKDKKGLGFDKKDTATTLSSILGEEDVIETTVTSKDINKAISKQLEVNGETTVTDRNVDEIIDRLQSNLNRSKSTVRLSNSVKEHIKQEIINKMNEPEYSGGLDEYTTSKLFSSVFRNDEVLETDRYYNKLTRAQIDEIRSEGIKINSPEYYDYLSSHGVSQDRIEIEKTRNDVMQKLKDINTRNEQARVKYGGILVNSSKMVKQYEKLNKGKQV